MKKFVTPFISLLLTLGMLGFVQSANAVPVPTITSSSSAVAPSRVTDFNASPEPVGVGDLIAVKGHLDRKPSFTWMNFGNARVTLQRKLDGGSYVDFENLMTNPLGDVATTVTATTSASWRLVFKGNLTTSPTDGPGDNVKVGPVQLKAVTKVTNWSDRSLAGEDWAKDGFTRTLNVKRLGPIAGPGACGGDAVKCFKYSFTIIDDGVFKSFKDGPSPNVIDVNLHGVIRGTLDGSLTGSFMANTPVLTAGLVPPLEDGDVDGQVASDSNWGTLALPVGQKFWGETIDSEGQAFVDDYTWIYVATQPDTCETFVKAASGNKGNLTGINACDE